MKNNEWFATIVRAQIDQAISEYIQNYGDLKLVIMNQEVGYTSEIVIERGSEIYALKG